MKQIVLITAYKEFEYLKKLASDLSLKGFRIYIHVDKKTCNEELLNYLNELKHVTAVTKFRVPWGGYQHIQAVLLLLRLACKENPDFNYVHVITGQDCLCRNVDELFSFFNSENKNNFMSCSGDDTYHFRYQTFYRNDWFNYKTKIGNLATKLLYVLQKCIGVNRKQPNGYQVYKGMLYVSITKEFSDYVLNFLNTDEGDKYWNWIKWCFVPEEFFFQTILMNSPYADSLVAKNFRYALWEMKHGTQPGIIDEEDFSAIRSSGAFWARKVNMNDSSKLIKLLEK